MKAVVLHEFGKPLELRDLPVPSIGPDEVLIKIKACGIDGTDLKLLNGFGYAPDLPFVIGHEPAGLIEQVGSNVSSWHPGDRVITYNFATCGKCSHCQAGRENLCQSMAGVLGVKDLPGGLAEFLKVPSKQIVRIPDSIAWHDAAVLSDAGITAYHAVKRSQIKTGQTVVIIGVGGVGAFVVQFAKLTGARVIAIEESSPKADRAERLGADVAFETS